MMPLFYPEHDLVSFLGIAAGMLPAHLTELVSFLTTRTEIGDGDQLWRYARFALGWFLWKESLSDNKADSGFERFVEHMGKEDGDSDVH